MTKHVTRLSFATAALMLGLVHGCSVRTGTDVGNNDLALSVAQAALVAGSGEDSYSQSRDVGTAVYQCPHTICDEGVPLGARPPEEPDALRATCNAETHVGNTPSDCVDQVCRRFPHCCTAGGYWGFECVYYAQHLCGVESCGCSAHSVCDEGIRLPAGCNSCTHRICRTDSASTSLDGDGVDASMRPSCCSTRWDSTCALYARVACPEFCQ